MKEWYILSGRPAGLAGLLWCQLTDTTQLPTGRHVVSLGHIILIPRKPVFSLTPQFYVLTGEATITNVTEWIDRRSIYPALVQFQQSMFFVRLIIFYCT